MPKKLLFFVVLSILFGILIIITSDNRVGNWAGVYTDHLRQVFMVGVASQSGMKIYGHTLKELAPNVFTSYRCYSWCHVPYVYPPGALFVFLVPYVITEIYPLSEQWVGKVCNLNLLVITGLCLYLILKIIPMKTRLNQALFLSLWLFGFFCAVNGFYELVWLTPAILGLHYQKNSHLDRYYCLAWRRFFLSEQLYAYQQW